MSINENDQPKELKEPKETEGPARLDLEDKGVYISNADAKDPVKYRRAKAIAAASGQTLRIDPETAPLGPPLTGAVIIPKNASVETYRRMKADTVTRGVPYQIGE